MKKINWFSRLFMSWKQIESFINDNSDTDVLAARLDEKEKQISKLEEALEKKNESTKFIETLYKKLELQNQELTSINKAAEAVKNDNNKKINSQEDMIKSLQEKLMFRQSEMDKLKKDIHDRLGTLNKIEKTFFGKSGNKGKGELGEMQLKTMLQKSGLDDDYWIENLIVGSSQVEFAIRSGEDEKWIPVDSKVLDTDHNEDGTIVLDEQYRQRVSVQAKNITKYLGKKNTAEYGLLVLQNDSIYLKLYEMYPLFFQETIQKYKIYICSPSSFIQFAWSISHILDIYKRVHKDEKIYDDMNCF